MATQHPKQHSKPSHNHVAEPSLRIVPPQMSWDRPIEEIILEYVRSMRQDWQTQQHANIWGKVRKDAKAIIMAYELVEEYIVHEMKLRAEIAASRQERVSTAANEGVKPPRTGQNATEGL